MALPTSLVGHREGHARSLLDYVDDFNSQYAALYQDRRPLFLNPLNEHGRRAFVCTTLRPCLPSNVQSLLHSAESCATFFASSLDFISLADHDKPPEHLLAPQFVIDAGSADSFGLANLNASVMCGTGYDAYVVYGLAPR